jgi:hypothetical protein
LVGTERGGIYCSMVEAKNTGIFSMHEAEFVWDASTTETPLNCGVDHFTFETFLYFINTCNFMTTFSWIVILSPFHLLECLLALLNKTL